MREGPEETIRRSCIGCKHLEAKNWAPKGWYSYEYSCAKENKHIGVISNTPSWCPFIRGDNGHNT